MPSFRFFKPLVRNLNDYGFAATAAKICGYLVKPFYENRTYRIYCIDLGHFQAPAEMDHTLYQYHLVNPDEVNLIRQIEIMAEWFNGMIRAKLLSDHLCLVALDGDKVAAFNLVALTKADIPLLQWERPLDKEEAWSEQITVDRQYRRKGLGRAVRHRMFRELQKRGIKRFCGGALISNTASLKLAQRSGFKEKEDIQFIKILWRKYWRHHEVKL